MQSSRPKLIYNVSFEIYNAEQHTYNHDRVLNKIGNENICTCAIEFFIVKSELPQA